MSATICNAGDTCWCISDMSCVTGDISRTAGEVYCETSGINCNTGATYWHTSDMTCVVGEICCDTS